MFNTVLDNCAMCFRKLGLFRFVADYNKPVASVEAAIKVHSDIGGSLIVLPEAFNIGKYYGDQGGDCDHSRKIFDQLKTVAGSFDVTFVAGLIVEEPNGPTPPFSSAYLIDGSGGILVCRKHGDDRSDVSPLTAENVRLLWNAPISKRIRLPNYTPFETTPDVRNPIQYRGSSIAAMICMDCNDEQVSGPVKEGFSKQAGPKIVCIPACINKDFGDEAIAGMWPQHHVILANSNPNGCRSFISKDGTIIERDNRGSENSIVLCAP